MTAYSDYRLANLGHHYLLRFIICDSFNASGTNSVRWLLPPFAKDNTQAQSAIICQWQSQDSNLGTSFQSPGSIISLLLMELLSSLTPPPFTVLETNFSWLRVGGGVRRREDMQPASQEACSGSLWQVQGLLGEWGRAGSYLLADGCPHICLSLKQCWIGFLDVYLHWSSSELGV